MAKILILLAQDICYGLLDSMAYNFGREINEMGIDTCYFDIKNEAPENIVNYISGDMIAVVDFYSGILQLDMSDGSKLFDVVGVPVYQFIFDYPIYVENILGCKLKNYHALCMDQDYVKALEDYYSVSKAFFFPIPGKEGNNGKVWAERKYDIVFVGNYVNYRSILALFDDCEPEKKQFAMDYFNKMITNTELNHMEALIALLDDRGIGYSKELLHQFFLQYGKIGRAARAYIREQMVKSLLEAGLSVDVYSDSWNDSVWSKYSNLIVHDIINEDEYLEILGDSKISLNCLYGNKAGYTERHGNSMLNGAITVADRTEYLAENFVDQEDIVFYDLDNMAGLPSKVRWILNNPEKANEISNNAKIKASARYTWKLASAQFLQLLLGEIEG